ncbi:DUF3231 family protein [Ferdinandcohnia quinoae]|uniref:DUF3231 family protein n=1 Tax=Fredinandcohnia quinoae TaxID=2918902 RepID=A0AAW5E4K5_9BACI|nr:DUF3231 family protein [Fredinandcohnia sp. SECRCQ15]MCH1624048.1 DUF3231 family protein [Fredinandcohnia sp. SECRCQ15]
MTEHHTQLTSAEIACIWTAYLIDSMSKCILSYFLRIIEDEDIRPIIELAHTISSSHIDTLNYMYKVENLPIPKGFTEEDVNLDAPRLYTDPFMLQYITHMARTGMLGFSSFVAFGARKEIKTFFIKGLQETADLFDKCTDVLLSKGLYIRAPYIPYPTQSDHVDSKKYLSGYSIFSKQRPLNAMEISHLYMNSLNNHIGSKLSLSFAQTSSNKKVEKWMIRGCEISQKHMKIFIDMLIDNNIQSPVSSDISITDSTTPPFSDKLTMFHMGLLSSAGIGNYATSAAASQRSDLVTNYERLSVEVAQFAKDGADIMISNEWMEQPPTTKDKEKLIKEK